MDTATVTGSPNSALVGGSGVTVTVAPVIEPLVRYSLTIELTSAVVDPSKTACRAPSRDALVIICWTITIRPYSIRPNTIRKNTGATRANSTAAAPRRFLRYNRQGLSSLSVVGRKLAANTPACQHPDSILATALVQVSQFIRASPSTRSN